MSKRNQEGAAHRADSARRSKERSDSIRDIADGFPTCKNKRARNKALKSFKYFCERCFPNAFCLKWSPDHLRVIEIVERIADEDGLFAVAMPRGSGKTTICERAAIWAVIRGSHPFVMIVGANDSSATETLKTIQSELLENENLYELFPEVCYPIRKLGNISHRSAGQSYNGRPTKIAWRANKVVLATIPEQGAKGGVITAVGLEAGFRGAKHSLPDGKQIRPSLVILDDPQTRKSAGSPTLTREREKIIAGDILGLVGPSGTIAALMPCTVVEPDDLADRYLDRDLHPDWQGIRTSMIEGWPRRVDLWEQYEQVRAESLRKAGDISLATDFYRRHKKEMDEGAKATWPERFNPNRELSAIQHAMELWIRDSSAFWAEYQNQPRRDEEGFQLLGPEEIQRKQNSLPRKLVPLDSHLITCHVDVQQEILFYTVIAWSQQFTGWIVEYGTWPEQSKNHFTLKTIRQGLSKAYTGNVGARIQAGLRDLVLILCEKTYRCEDNSQRKIDAVGIDVGWRPRDVDRVIRDFALKRHTNLVAVRGFGISARDRPLSQRSYKAGDRFGLHWAYPMPKTTAGIRRLQVDTKFWKTRTHQQLSTPLGDPGSLSLHTARPESHAMIADHLTSEFPTEITGPWGTIDQWTLRPGRAENHFLDNIVGATCLASFMGLSAPDLDEGDSTQDVVQRRRVNVKRLVRS